MNLLSRRSALKKMYAYLLYVGAGSFLSFDDLLAADSRYDKPAVIWLHASSCTGCTCSLLNIEDVPVVDLLTQFIDLVYHPDLSSATGEQAIGVIEKLLRSDKKFLFVLEGSIPTALPHACLLADQPISNWVEKLSSRATACVSVGTCSAFGGIPAMCGSLTGAVALDQFLNQRQIKTPVINLPNCPVKPEHLVYCLLHYSKLNTIPELDSFHRPKRFFKHTLHDRCLYHSDFQEERFAEFIGDDGCLFRLGCRGPATNNDCFSIGHNSNTNSCIKSGHPCIGCAGGKFPEKILFHNCDDSRITDKTT